MASGNAASESDSGSQKLDISIQNRRGNTPLHNILAKTYNYHTPEEIQKLEEKDIQNIKLMLKLNSDVNLKNAEGYTCVHLAIKNKRSDALVQVLLDHGAECDYNFKDKEGRNVLYHVVSPTNYDVKNYPQKYLDYNFKFRDGSIIKHLIEKGAEIDACAKNGYSPLLLAVVLRKTEYVKIMLEKEANLSEDVLEKIINTSADTYWCKLGNKNYPRVEYYGMTPLQIAVYDINKAMAELLIKAGANVNVVDGKGDNALHMIIKGNISWDRRDATEEQTEIAKFLIVSGININAKDGSGETALHLAVTKDKQNLFTYILEKALATV